MPQRLTIAQDLELIESVNPETGARIEAIVVNYGVIREQSRECAETLGGGV